MNSCGDRLVELGERRERIEHVERDRLRARRSKSATVAASTVEPTTGLRFLIDLSLVGHAGMHVLRRSHLIPVMVMPSMKRRRAIRKAMTSGAVRTVAAAVSAP